MRAHQRRRMRAETRALRLGAAADLGNIALRSRMAARQQELARHHDITGPLGLSE